MSTAPPCRPGPVEEHRGDSGGQCGARRDQDDLPAGHATGDDGMDCRLWPGSGPQPGSGMVASAAGAATARVSSVPPSAARTPRHGGCGSSRSPKEQVGDRSALRARDTAAIPRVAGWMHSCLRQRKSLHRPAHRRPTGWGCDRAPAREQLTVLLAWDADPAGPLTCVDGEICGWLTRQCPVPARGRARRCCAGGRETREGEMPAAEAPAHDSGFLMR
jgi:hypothetical protein